ncbi:MAG: permease-like cell division protein FtsX [Synergistales bacterium]|nr:permease-like cell division protein FtsX [Bacteroidales bacterium]MDY6394009.1 permease-like cell division protein FtsX [Bacteroidales bacterium]MDY6403449.1 permease-like cell division protein FtsX [Bacteroidales bacterium]MDY6435354.1 permease-like cell division protein FtsX [Synergistales bacterium]
MSEKKSNKNPKARLFTANFSTALSIALVLFIVAFIGLFSFHVWVLSNEIKENVSFTIYMTTDATEQDGLNLQKQVAKNPVVKNVEYHSLEEVTQMMNKDFGENHLDVLEGYNPYSASLEVHLKAKAMKVKQIKQFITTIESKPEVEMVDYRDDMINKINTVYYNLSYLVIIILLSLIFISVTLINHTIALTIRNKKLLIRSMQLVGAKPSYIRKPFLVKGLWLGLVGGLIADVLVAAVLFWMLSILNYPDVSSFYNIYILSAIGIIVLGVVLSFIFSYFAVIRNMNLKNYKLYN